jgi:hypothetical protein
MHVMDLLGLEVRRLSRRGEGWPKKRMPNANQRVFLKRGVGKAQGYADVGRSNAAGTSWLYKYSP